ncbi:response regulator [uncultured Rhodoblastus sp.]|uniref:response regulator n=1 Tax=uncultured Rhodoblastus sp. TaxID=543037 RepID=UPI0025D7B031|nr:response regulator [uncultured Rhodoblastus sp.]
MALIVIVDDRDTNRTIYSRLALSIGEGVRVHAFGDPCAALEWLERNRPDMIVTDYDMPQINGEEFIGRFRAMPHSSAVPIMMITVNDRRMLRLRALESGATDFLTTPIDHYEFLSRARNLLKLSKSAGTQKPDTLERPSEAQPAPAASAPEDAIAIAAAQFEAQGGETGGNALHVVEIGGPGRDSFDPDVVVAALRRQLRGDDLIARLDRRRFAVLQRNVFDAADADACARRLLALRDLGGFAALGALGGVVKVGTSPPRDEVGAPEKSAAARLREAADSARAQPEPAAEPWVFQPLIDLHSGAVVGARALNGAGLAEADDPEAVRAVLSFASALRSSGRPSFRLGLRLDMKPSASAPLALLLAPLLAATRVPPSWLDLRICAREALEHGDRAKEQAQALRALGIGLTLDLGAPGPKPLDGVDAARTLRGFAQMWRPTIQFPSGDRNAMTLAYRLGRRAEGQPPLPLLADGVASSVLLRPLLRAGVGLAQGSCFGAPFPPRDLEALLAGGRGTDGGPQPAARRA